MTRSFIRVLVRSVAACLVASVVALSFLVGFASPASAHAELRASSPAADSTVGGSFHSIVLQFSGLSETAPQQAILQDPGGSRVPGVMVQEGQQLVIPIEPLTIPGQYTVRYALSGQDNDQSSGSFVFRFDPSAPEPVPLPGLTTPGQGFDFVRYGLLLVAAALLGFLVHRFSMAWRDHRAAAALRTESSDAPAHEH